MLKVPRTGDKNTNSKKNEKQNSQKYIHNALEALNFYSLQTDFISFKQPPVASVPTYKGEDKRTKLFS